jgi:hypothetical protein
MIIVDPRAHCAPEAQGFCVGPGAGTITLPPTGLVKPDQGTGTLLVYLSTCSNLPARLRAAAVVRISRANRSTLLDHRITC